MLLPGTIVSEYQVDSVLGRGSHATVYLVKHQTTGAKYALKVFSFYSDALKQRMEATGELLADMNHANVVAVQKVMDINGRVGLLMEFVEGQTLSQLIEEQGRLSLDEAEVIFRAIVVGVRHAHQHGVVHWNLNPGNVFLIPSESGFIPKVCDFGIVRAFTGDRKGLDQTQNDMPPGVANYMSTEQIKDSVDVDERADIFSLGCILYELLTGQKAFPGTDTIQVFQAVVKGEYVPPETLSPKVPKRVRAAVRGALQQERDKRIATCTELLDILAGTIRWKPPVSHPPLEQMVMANEPQGDDSQVPSKSSNRMLWLVLLVVGGGMAIIMVLLALIAIAGAGLALYLSLM